LKRRYIGQDAMTLKLYSAVSPALNYDSVPGNFSEVSGGGYSAAPLSSGGFTETIGSGAQKFSFGHATQTFLFTAANISVAGYFVTVTCDLGDGSQTYVLWAEPIDINPFVTAGYGDKINITPKVEL
jgi:hypothetical protein